MASAHGDPWFRSFPRHRARSLFSGSTREYLLDTPLGAIKAEEDAALAARETGSAIAFDLPVEKAARLKKFG